MDGVAIARRNHPSYCMQYSTAYCCVKPPAVLRYIAFTRWLAGCMATSWGSSAVGCRMLLALKCRTAGATTMMHCWRRWWLSTGTTGTSSLTRAAAPAHCRCVRGAWGAVLSGAAVLAVGGAQLLHCAVTVSVQHSAASNQPSTPLRQSCCKHERLG